MLFILLTVIAISFFSLGIRIYQLNHASQGPEIKKEQNSKALLVLDIQNDILKQYKNSSEQMNNVNNVINKASKEGIPIIYSKQEFTNPIDLLLTGGMLKKDSMGASLSDKVSILSSNIFSKNRNDLFSNKSFTTFLSKNNIGDLYIVGADASSCVLTTTTAALNRGYKVTIINDSVFSVNQDTLDKVTIKYTDKGALLENHSTFLN